MITVVSGQPRSSKWWWIGAMRKTRRPNSWKLATWIITDRVSTTNRAPMTASRSEMLFMRARPARPAPMARDPVSPMKIWAGDAFHHRKPTHAPVMHAATTARSRAWGTP